MKSDNLDFNGQGGVGYTRMKDRFAGNQHGATMRENYGTGPTKGNAGKIAGPATAAAKGGKINGGATVKKPANADKINVK